MSPEEKATWTEKQRQIVETIDKLEALYEERRVEDFNALQEQMLKDSKNFLAEMEAWGDRVERKMWWRMHLPTFFFWGFALAAAGVVVMLLVRGLH